MIEKLLYFFNFLATDPAYIVTFAIICVSIYMAMVFVPILNFIFSGLISIVGIIYSISVILLKNSQTVKPWLPTYIGTVLMMLTIFFYVAPLFREEYEEDVFYITFGNVGVRGFEMKGGPWAGLGYTLLGAFGGGALLTGLFCGSWAWSYITIGIVMIVFFLIYLGVTIARIVLKAKGINSFMDL